MALHADNEEVRSISVTGVSMLPLSPPAALFLIPKYARSNEISRLRCPHILLGKRSALFILPTRVLTTFAVSLINVAMLCLGTVPMSARYFQAAVDGQGTDNALKNILGFVSPAFIPPLLAAHLLPSFPRPVCACVCRVMGWW